MKCVIKLNEFNGNHLSKTKLIGEDNQGKQTRLLSGLTLSVNEDNFTMTNGNGEIVRRGITDNSPESVFAVFDSTLFDMDKDNLAVETTDFSGTFADFEEVYGIGRVERDQKAKFHAYTKSVSDTEAAIGLVRYDRKKVYEIHSIYIDKALSRKEKINFLCEYILDNLKACEYANVQATGFSPDRKSVEYAGLVNVYITACDHRFEQAWLLHDDALTRKSTLKEVFDEPVTYDKGSENVAEEHKEGTAFRNNGSES